MIDLLSLFVGAVFGALLTVIVMSLALIRQDNRHLEQLREANNENR